MGWVAYAVTRPNGERRSVIFPKLSTSFTLAKNPRTTMADILGQNPDFPVEAHVFTWSTWVDRVHSYGFGNTIAIDEFWGETWTLDNGSRLVFGPKDKPGVAYSDVAGKGYSSFASDLSNGRIFFPICVYQENNSGTLPNFRFNDDGTYLIVPESTFPSYVFSPDTFFKGATPITPPTENNDPYGDGGESGIGGGTGSFDGTGDDISIPSPPTLSATDAGFITLFNPSLEQMHSLSSYMWSDLFDVNGWKKIFADPMDAILGLSIVPVAVPNGGTKEVKVGNIPTGVNMTVAASQYVTVDCGTLNVNEYWGAYLDYDPYTKAEIYLPYIGTHPLATDDIMNKPVHVVYHVDILSGACCALVQCGGAVLYSFVGQCSSSIPITGDNWANVINGAISIAGSIGSMVATGGASAPFAAGQIASTSVNTMKPSVEKSGAMGGTGGMLGVQTPYLILTRPRQAVPKNQNSFTGYPAFITEVLGDLSGYTEIDSIHLENVPATEPELSEIESLLKSGVIL